MDRRCNNGVCLMMAGAKTFNLDLPVATVLDRPRSDWNMLTAGGRMRIARDIEVDWKNFSQDNYLFTHASIVASCELEDDGHTIKAACNELVNNNGNAWSNEVLLATFKSFVGAENYLEHCFPAGTRVLMADGTYKNIENVRAGDRVVNRLGGIGVVSNTQKRLSNRFVNFSSNKIVSRQLRMTGNHPLWVLHAVDRCPKTARLNNPPRRSERPRPDWKGRCVGVHGKDHDTWSSGWVTAWKNADDMNPDRDALSMVAHGSAFCPCEEINSARAELIGWFMAEGSYGTSNKFVPGETSVQFALGADERGVAERLKSLLIQEFGEHFRSDCEPRIYETEYRGQPSGVNLSLSNQVVTDFFMKWCGKYAWKKKLAEEAIWISPDLQAVILHSYLSGDGCGKIEYRGYIAGTVSRALCHQMSFMANRIGLHPSIKEDCLLKRYSRCIEDGEYPVYEDPMTGKKRRPEHLLRFSVGDSICLDRMVKGETKFVAPKSEVGSHVFERQWFGFWADKKIDIVDDEVEVYNFEVEGDNSYIVEGVIVHNCQVPELSKGKILDAVIRPVHFKGRLGEADIYFCDILVATHRKHEDLVDRISKGKLNTMSMGCMCDWVQCSKCGKVLGDNDVNCSHLDHEMLQRYIDKNGVQRIVSELCGRTVMRNGKRVGDPKSCKFIEASWVERPAFKGAVINHYLSDISKVAAQILTFPTAKLNECVDDIFKLRVADRMGMMVLNVARQEIIRRKREAMIERLTVRV